MCGEEATTKATICDPELRTVNTQAECGSAADIYYYSPWRAPGSAPTIDAWCDLSCHLFGSHRLTSSVSGSFCNLKIGGSGSAGGRFPGQGKGGAGAQFANSSVAHQGMVGSALPKGPAAATWQAGVAYEVGWTIQA